MISNWPSKATKSHLNRKMRVMAGKVAMMSQQFRRMSRLKRKERRKRKMIKNIRVS